MGILVIGGAGFIGSNLVDTLMAEGHEVTVYDNFSEGKVENLDRWRGDPRLEVIRADIRDYDSLLRAADHKEWCFHLGAMSRIQPSIIAPLEAFQTNYMGTANVLEACRQAGVKRVVYSASSSAYGLRNPIPNEESMPTDCLNPYSLSKKGGEELCKLYNDLYGLSTCALRYFNVYGPRHQEEGSYSTVIAIFRKQKRLGQKLTIVGDGEQRRDFTFVGDVVRANILAAMNRDATGLYNIGCGKNYSINDLATMVGGESVHIPPRPAEARVTLADNRLAAEVLGWKPQVSLSEGLQVLDMYERKNPRYGILVPA